MNKFNIPVIIDTPSKRRTYLIYVDHIEHFINDINHSYFIIKMYSRLNKNNTKFGINLRYKNKD